MEKEVSQEKRSSDVAEVRKPVEVADLSELSKKMLQSAFGPSFNIEEGRPKAVR